MNMFSLALIALVLSAVPIVMLCMGDPKRRRAVGGKGSGMAPGQRRLLVVVACIPGAICAGLGDAAAFLMWLGGCALIGWILAAYLPARAND